MVQRAKFPVRTVVADDSAHFRAALLRILATMPHIQVIAEARDGAETLRLVDELAPDLLLLDLRMPNFDGLEVVQRLYAMGARVQVVVLSAECRWSCSQPRSRTTIRRRETVGPWR